jgi:hypothetical protein
VHQQQVHEVETERAQAGIQHLALPADVLRAQLRGDEHLRRVQAAVPRRRPTSVSLRYAVAVSINR